MIGPPGSAITPRSDRGRRDRRRNRTAGTRGILRLGEEDRGIAPDRSTATGTSSVTSWSASATEADRRSAPVSRESRVDLIRPPLPGATIAACRRASGRSGRSRYPRTASVSPASDHDRSRRPVPRTAESEIGELLGSRRSIPIGARLERTTSASSRKRSLPTRERRDTAETVSSVHQRTRLVEHRIHPARRAHRSSNPGMTGGRNWSAGKCPQMAASVSRSIASAAALRTSGSENGGRLALNAKKPVSGDGVA